MGTGGTLTLQNQLPSTLISNVSATTCMYENGDDNSHLEYFNCSLAANGSLGPQYIEANGNLFSGCGSTQSQFTLDLSVTDGNGGQSPLGQVAIDLGSGAYNTGVVSNSCPEQIAVSIDSDRHITVLARPVPAVVQFANSWLGANMPGIQAEFSLPPVSLGPISFGAAALQGLSQLAAVDGSVSGSVATTVELGLQLYAPSLLTDTTVSFGGSSVSGGLSLTDVTLSATVAVSFTPMTILVTGISLTGGSVNLNADGLDIPNFLLSGLFALVESAFDNDPIQSAVLAELNKHL